MTASDIGPALRERIARADEAWGGRDDPGRLELCSTELAAAERSAPDEGEVLWRLSRLHFWRSDDPALADAEKSRVGKLAWEYGDRAAAALPGRVEGPYFAAVGIGSYALGLGIVKALAHGVEGKFKERLARAQELDPAYFWGGVWVAWGRFYMKLPWPKYDRKKAEASLKKAFEVNPENVRARLFLAELHEKDDPAEARRLLDEALAHRPGTYDAPEELRAQELCRATRAALEA